jgi:hypothetical protein
MCIVLSCSLAAAPPWTPERIERIERIAGILGYRPVAGKQRETSWE